VKPALNYLRSLSPVKYIGLKQPTLKLCCLLALVSAERAQTLAKLTLSSMTERGSKIVFNVTDLLKQSRPGNVGHKIELLAYPPDRRVCIQKVLKEYIARTKLLRKDENQLFISYKPPHKKVCKDTISRWVRTVLALSGIDVSKFKAHSTRAASTSVARARYVPLTDIIRTAGWSNDRTFQKYYNKPIQQDSRFANAILDNN